MKPLPGRSISSVAFVGSRGNSNANSLRLALGGFFATRDAGRAESTAHGISAVVSSALSTYGSTVEGLSDLETLINSPKTQEGDLRCFLRLHPQFLFALNEGYCEIKSHVCLAEENGDRHVPDFMARI